MKEGKQVRKDKLEETKERHGKKQQTTGACNSCNNTEKEEKRERGRTSEGKSKERHLATGEIEVTKSTTHVTLNRFTHLTTSKSDISAPNLSTSVRPSNCIAASPVRTLLTSLSRGEERKSITTPRGPVSHLPRTCDPGADRCACTGVGKWDGKWKEGKGMGEEFGKRFDRREF